MESIDDQPKQAKHKLTLRMRKITRKRVFTEFVASRQMGGDNSSSQGWKCCNQFYDTSLEMYKHVSTRHIEEVESRVQTALEKMSQGKKNPNPVKDAPPETNGAIEEGSTGLKRASQLRQGPAYKADDVFPWLPNGAVGLNVNDGEAYSQDGGEGEEGGQVLLFYKYTKLIDPDDISAWQKELCRRLQLHGKVRVASEGLNGTVGGHLLSTQQYIQAVLAHPCFSDMTVQDFKTSEGGRESFPDGLVVSSHQEIVPMGIHPSRVSFEDAGSHLTPAQFHEEVESYHKARETGQESDRVLVDCRNFYESKIGTFTEAIKPDIRKFSYWPEYVDKNKDLFADKRVLMYCTGGIRCERGSAYLRSKGICKDVLQLEGGIHRYLEEYPDGYFRGKLFVFDDRYSIQSNKDVIAECVHCSRPWDQYQPCTSTDCHQLVLACPTCRETGLTTCCRRCAELADLDASRTDEGSRQKKKKRREECECTASRERIPVEKIDSR